MTSMRQRRVVIVDAEHDFLVLVDRRVGRAAGFEVVAHGRSGSEALGLVTEHRPDVLLLDLGLNDIADEDLILRVVVAAPETMVAVLTGRAAEQREDAARAAGAFTYYEKDVISQHLVDYLDADCQLFERALAGEDVVAPSAITRRRPTVGR